MAEEIDLEKCNFRKFRSPVTLTLTLDRVIRHAVVHQLSTSIYKPNFIEIGKTFCGQTYGRTYGRTDVPTDKHFRPSLMLLDHLEGVDLTSGYATWFTAGGAIRIGHYDIIDDVITQKL